MRRSENHDRFHTRDRTRSALILALGITILFGVGDVAFASTEIIREIRIVRGNVFTESEANQNRAFHTANVMHVTTRDHVIRGRLLFSEGEVVDNELLLATERAIRELEFVNEARIRVIRVDDRTVDIEVHTDDAWTLVPGIVFESGGGITEVGATAADTNFAGFGKKLWVEGIHNTDEGTNYAAGYTDPQVLNTWWQADVNFKTGPLIDAVNFSALRPFYSPDTEWAFGGFANWRSAERRLFENGDEVSRFLESSRRAQIFAARAFGPRYNKLTADLQFVYDERRFDFTKGTPVSLPDDELNLTTSVGLFWRKESWVKENRIRKMTITEDIRLGHEVGARVGRAGIPIPKGEKYWDVRGSYRHAMVPGHGQYLFLSNDVSTEDDQNTILRTQARYFYKVTPWQTLALNVQFKRAWNLESSRQISLGGESGLRGFRARRFNGNKSVLMNAETRLFSPLEIYTVALGAVAFVDAGRAWESGSQIDLDELGYSVGVGMRFGFTRAPGEPIGRIDLGWPLSDGGFAFTIGSEQQF
jgi:hypothetical protein